MKQRRNTTYGIHTLLISLQYIHEIPFSMVFLMSVTLSRLMSCIPNITYIIYEKKKIILSYELSMFCN